MDVLPCSTTPLSPRNPLDNDKRDSHREVTRIKVNPKMHSPPPQSSDHVSYVASSSLSSIASATEEALTKDEPLATPTHSNPLPRPPQVLLMS